MEQVNGATQKKQVLFSIGSYGVSLYKEFVPIIYTKLRKKRAKLHIVMSVL